MTKPPLELEKSSACASCLQDSDRLQKVPALHQRSEPLPQHLRARPASIGTKSELRKLEADASAAVPAGQPCQLLAEVDVALAAVEFGVCLARAGGSGPAWAKALCHRLRTALGKRPHRVLRWGCYCIWVHLGCRGLQGPAWPLDVVIILISCTLLCCGWFRTKHNTALTGPAAADSAGQAATQSFWPA